MQGKLWRQAAWGGVGIPVQRGAGGGGGPQRAGPWEGLLWLRLAPAWAVLPCSRQLKEDSRRVKKGHVTHLLCKDKRHNQHTHTHTQTQPSLPANNKKIYFKKIQRTTACMQCDFIVAFYILHLTCIIIPALKYGASNHVRVCAVKILALIADLSVGFDELAGTE